MGGWLFCIQKIKKFFTMVDFGSNETYLLSIRRMKEVYLREDFYVKKNVIVSIVIVAFIFVTGAMFDTTTFSCFVSAAASVFDTGVKIW